MEGPEHELENDLVVTNAEVDERVKTCTVVVVP